MKITMTSTSEVVLLSEATLARVWDGVTESGIKVRVLVPAVAVPNDADPAVHAAFKREMIEVANPLAPGVKLGPMPTEPESIAEEPEPSPRPSDPQFQFLMLLCARKAGDQLLESLAREWLAESGVHVVFTDDLNLAGNEDA